MENRLARTRSLSVLIALCTSLVSFPTVARDSAEAVTSDRFDLDVDSNRNGIVEVTEDEGEANVGERAGAIVMTNYDDDDLDGARDAIAIDAQGRPVAGNLIIERGDASDITPLVIRHPPTAELASGRVKLFLEADRADLRTFHLFGAIAPGTTSVWGGMREQRARIQVTSLLRDTSPGAPKATRLGIEALFFRDTAPGAYGGTFPQGFDGEIRFRLVTVIDGIESTVDEIVFSVAPFLLLPSTHAAVEVWAKGPDSRFVAALRAGGSGVPVNGYVSPGDDRWAQDHAEIGYTHAPGRPKTHITMQLPRPDRNGPRLAAWPAVHLLRANKGVFALGGDLGGGAGDFGGNIELLPPTAGAPAGRVLLGTTVSERLFGFFSDQGSGDRAVQPLVSVDTTWLAVGHVDEMIGFQGDASAPKLVAASPNSALCLLGGTRDAPGLDVQGRPCPSTGIPPPRDDAVFFATDGPDGDAVIETAAGIATGAPPTSNGFVDGTRDFTSERWRYIRIYDGTGRGQVAGITSRADGSLQVGMVWDTTSRPRIAAPAPSSRCVGDRCVGVVNARSNDGWFVMPDETSRYVLAENSKSWLSFDSADPPALTTVYEVRGDHHLWSVNRDAQRRSDRAVSDIQAAAGGSLTVVEVPNIYMGRLDADGAIVDRSAVAFTPNAANFQGAGATTFFPKPFGPNLGGRDVFEQRIQALFPSAVFIDEWDAFHQLDGEVHCGTNVVRQPFSADWWSVP
ncbi:MAG: protein-arginine deiminase family protein [Actinomycetota bacterium]